MRLFVAVRPPLSVAEVAAVAVGRALRDAGTAQLRVAPVDQLHLTLAFYGEVAEGVVPELTDRLRRAAARTPAVDVQLRGAGAFPRARSGQVLWLGMADAGDGLRRLAERSAAAGRRVGLALEDRRWRAHLTVARVRSRRPADLSAVVSKLDEWSSEPWRVSEIELVRSHLGPTVRHEVLERFALAELLEAHRPIRP